MDCLNGFLFKNGPLIDFVLLHRVILVPPACLVDLVSMVLLVSLAILVNVVSLATTEVAFRDPL